MLILPYKTFFLPKTTKEGDLNWGFFLKNGADMFWPFISQKSHERGGQVTFWKMTKTCKLAPYAIVQTYSLPLDIWQYFSTYPPMEMLKSIGLLIDV